MTAKKIFPEYEIGYNENLKETTIILILSGYPKSKWLPIKVKTIGSTLVGKGTNGAPNTKENKKYISTKINETLNLIADAYPQ